MTTERDARQVKRYSMTGQHFDRAYRTGTDERQVTVTVVLATDYDALVAENERLKGDLETYGWHDIKKCDATNSNGVRFVDMECTCGFDAALHGGSK